MSAAPECPQCGERLPGDVPGGLCPACLLRMVRDGDTGTLDGSGAGQGPRDPTTDGSPVRLAGSRASNHLGETVTYHRPAVPRQEHGAEQRGEKPTPPVDLDRFLEALTRLGLRDQAGVEESVERFLGRPGPKAAEELARELVRGGRLTEYQAGAILQGKSRGLAIGNYLVLDKIGVGGMGLVFKALHRRMRRIVALKVLPPSFARNTTAVMRFRREAEAAARLSHPNVVAVLDADEFNGLHFFAMEFVAGRDLERLVADDGPLSARRAIEYIVRAARGLGAAHAHGIYHRDIKPSNLLLDACGSVKVLDLGLARVTKGSGLFGSDEADVGLTRPGDLMGTVAYMSPEQAYNAQDADHRSDIYSLGCTLYYLLTGRPPYDGVTHMACLLAHREQPIPSLHDARPEILPTLDATLRRMMAKLPEDRQPSMDAVLADLESYLDSPPEADAEPAPASCLPVDTESAGPPEPRTRARRRGPVVVVSVVCLAAVLALVQANRPRTPPQPRAPALARTVPVAPQSQSTPVRDPSTPDVKTPGETPKDQPPPTEPIGVVRPLQMHKDHQAVEGIVVTRDGKLALSVGRDWTVRCGEVETGTELWHREHDKACSVAISPDGLRAVSGGGDGTIRLWNVAEGLAGGRLGGHQQRVNSVAISTDGQRVLSGSNDRTVRLWEVATHHQVRQFLHDGPVTAVALSPDGTRALSGSNDRSVRVWDLESPQPIAFRRFNGKAEVLCVAFSPTGDEVLSGGKNGIMKLCSLTPPKEIRPLVGPRGDWVQCVAFLPDGRHALSGTQGGKLILWNLDDGRELYRHVGEAAHLGVAVLPDGKHALTADEDGLVRYWRLPDIEDPDTPPDRLEGDPAIGACPGP